MTISRPFLTLVILLQTGCIPFPVPPHLYDRRENVHQEILTFIKQGNTTREQILLMLGEPDGAALDDSWMVFSSASAKGGIGILVVGGGSSAAVGLVEHAHFFRLIIHFDSEGIVDFVNAEEKSCPMSGFSAGDAEASSKPCLDMFGRDIPALYNWSDRVP